jgi:uncharacterized glyoxalase superfamily protein PhnB
MALDAGRPTIYPTLRYDDAPAAIKFLTAALGFTQRSVTPNPAGTIAHAELGFGNGVVMISSRTDPPGTFDTGRSCLYLVVDDPDAHHDRAVAAGAEIVMPLTDQDYGSREYAARDAEGNVWCFGTYRPSEG